jgi:transposase
LLELIPGGAKKDLSARQAKALLAKVRPRELTELLAATGTSLLDLPGIGLGALS